ncbi:MAG TPA: TetR/AcrR family transcriptional regulator [Gordonia sp. (in: high G+C Gram-positive bacteria)]|uniref:TetR/AcrR family transcriptional regulator n=1 Tax=unclassified Gordonia (in: high G+C Gram-positive bacteria) TaxID=2657482 RepID=UPI000F9C62CB|nr:MULTISPECIES: TetR/AcrR family transcriptional regulator [unclassified Gordonia (in: high G+C Gram-positive bacteria)]RUP39050.1 MAG: TetR/AcrR family transcriptional regulator [Gordonia sp. (in: high G+C Gram-positive bacteria)]HNP56850.1 TetR/AcrR family transcriptional regulator [Gordonia sp. (in: high G+C Gram-positive bacteria)]HRC49820.1 TetR/AcrR family transcriptional regulator [Gordonia sp. (in: high G+C Gram-positive bacteria)]
MARAHLTREKVVDAAVAVADAGGLSAVSMRNVGRELGVEAMSLYHHVADKSALLDAMVDWIFTRIELPAPDDGWRDGMVRRADSARAVLAAHPWALGLVDSRRTPGPALLTHHNAVLGCLRRNGFTVELASHAFSAIDSYVYGFVLTEMNLPFSDGADELVGEFTDALPVADYPYLAELAETVVTESYRFADEYSYGLDLVLDSIAVRRR